MGVRSILQDLSLPLSFYSNETSFRPHFADIPVAQAAWLLRTNLRSKMITDGT
jgi:hypothetical protein